jgi:hypothetical protein
MKAGESFSTLTPRPLFTMADLSVRRIRAEVDERDVSKVRVGQKVLISSDALQNQLLQGVVGRISDTMGRKRILTGDPSEKADRDVLEAMIDLDAAVKLPVGMRVTVQFQEVRQRSPKPSQTRRRLPSLPLLRRRPHCQSRRLRTWLRGPAMPRSIIAKGATYCKRDNIAPPLTS